MRRSLSRKQKAAFLLEHSEELQRVVQTQFHMYREYDIIQQEEKAVQWEVWEQHEQLQLWYRHKARRVATAHVEIITHCARVESDAAARSLERELDVEAVADKVEKRCQRQHAEALAAAQSQIELILQACWCYQLQLKDAEDTLKEFVTEAQRALDLLAAQARAREDELQKHHQFCFIC